MAPPHVLQSDPVGSMEHAGWADGALLASADHEQKHHKENEEEDMIFMLSGAHSPDQNTSYDGAWGLRGAVVPTWV